MGCRLILNKLCNFYPQLLAAQQIATFQKHKPKIHFFKLLKILRIFPLFLMVFNFFIALPKRNFPDFLASTPKSQPRPPAPPGCSVTALAVRKSYSDFHTGPAASRRRKAPRLFTSDPSFRFQEKPLPTLWAFPPAPFSPHRPCLALSPRYGFKTWVTRKVQDIGDTLGR